MLVGVQPNRRQADKPLVLIFDRNPPASAAISTDLRVKEIAEQLGYDTPSYFERVFTRLMGIAPLRERKNSRAWLATLPPGAPGPVRRLLM
jgi:AraC-like DNA-binding protein